MKTNALTLCPSHQERVWGLTYLIFQLLFLPSLLFALNAAWGLTIAQLNFVFFSLNFLAIVWIFRDFLIRSWKEVREQPGSFWKTVILGTAVYFALSEVVKWIIPLLAPDFANANDAGIAAMSHSSRFLIAFATTTLVPPVEECLYRGLVFGSLYRKNRAAAYAVSILAFCAIHIFGYLSAYSPVELAMAVLQYLPGGLCLAWAYAKTNTIFTPIVIHAIINAVGICLVR